MPPILVHRIDSLAQVTEAEWNALAGENPSLQFAYLRALERSLCASEATGWKMAYLTASDRGLLVGAIPLYFKSHSYGEFVFDWAWAEAYEQHGLAYYPKLVSSVPFTPINGERMLGRSAEVRSLLTKSALALAKESGVSSLHFLFPTEDQAQELASHGMMVRRQIQFHWKNLGYRDFSHFLAGMRHDKRKKILRERRRLRESGFTFERIRGRDLRRSDWDFFYACYLRTHHLYRSPVPLSLDFFLEIGRSMPDKILLVFGSRHGQRIAASLDLFDENNLYGRSWGALEHHTGLHFEVCYYQAIEFCLERGITNFEGGAQGEHKLARGFLPVATYSAHWLDHPEFSHAVEDFLRRESAGMELYLDELNESNPFKRGPLPP